MFFSSSGGFGGFSGGVEAKGGASSSDIKEAAKEVTVVKVHGVVQRTLNSGLHITK